MPRISFVAALAVGALSFFACLGDAHAQSDGARQTARQRYAEAQAQFDSGQFAAAEASFRAAYAAVPNPVVLRAIASAQERQGNTAGAAQTLQQYLRDSPAATDRADVERRIAAMTRSAGGGGGGTPSAGPSSVVLTSTPSGAQVILDGRPTGQVTPVELQIAPGQHTIELRASGQRPVQQRITLAAAQRARISVDIATGVFGTGGDGVGAGGGGGGGGEGSADPSIGVWIAAGVGAAGLISGTVFGFLALSEQSNFDAQPTNETADRGETFALVADISFGIAAAAAITAVVLYIVERSSGSSGSARLQDGEGLQLGVSPWADPNGGGVAAQLRF